MHELDFVTKEYYFRIIKFNFTSFNISYFTNHSNYRKELVSSCYDYIKYF